MRGNRGMTSCFGHIWMSVKTKYDIHLSEPIQICLPFHGPLPAGTDHSLTHEHVVVKWVVLPNSWPEDWFVWVKRFVVFCQSSFGNYFAKRSFGWYFHLLAYSNVALSMNTCDIRTLIHGSVPYSVSSVLLGSVTMFSRLVRLPKCVCRALKVAFFCVLRKTRIENLKRRNLQTPKLGILARTGIFSYVNKTNYLYSQDPS
jgi:hypothetical protein